MLYRARCEAPASMPGSVVESTVAGAVVGAHARGETCSGGADAIAGPELDEVSTPISHSDRGVALAAAAAAIAAARRTRHTLRISRRSAASARANRRRSCSRATREGVRRDPFFGVTVFMPSY